jgi:hypothetical protein
MCVVNTSIKCTHGVLKHFPNVLLAIFSGVALGYGLDDRGFESL